MPDKNKIINEQYEKARAARILELSRKWGVPTSSIYSRRNNNATSPYTAPGASISYWTFDPQGKVNNSIRDINPYPLGDSQYTAADIQLQRQYPGQGMTVQKLQALQGQADGSITELAEVSAGLNKEDKTRYEGGGKMKKYAKGGGLSRDKDRGSDKKPYPSVKSSDFAGGDRSYPIPTRADAVDALRLAGLHGRADVRAKIYKKYPSLKKAEYGLKLIDSYNKAQFGANMSYNNPEDELLPLRQPINISDDLQNSVPIIQTMGSPWNLQTVGGQQPIRQDLQSPPSNNGIPLDYSMMPSTQQTNQSVRDYFANDRYRNYIPANASLEGPSPYENEYLMNPRNQSVVQSDYRPIQFQGLQTEEKKAAPVGGNFNINAGQIMSGLFGAVNQLYDRNAGIKENARLKRMRTQAPSYNPNPQGTGSQAIYKNGGIIPGETYDLTKDQIDFLRSQGYDLEIVK